MKVKAVSVEAVLFDPRPASCPRLCLTPSETSLLFTLVGVAAGGLLVVKCGSARHINAVYYRPQLCVSPSTRETVNQSTGGLGTRRRDLNYLSIQSGAAACSLLVVLLSP